MCYMLERWKTEANRADASLKRLKEVENGVVQSLKDEIATHLATIESLQLTITEKNLAIEETQEMLHDAAELNAQKTEEISELMSEVTSLSDQQAINAQLNLSKDALSGTIEELQTAMTKVAQENGEALQECEESEKDRAEMEVRLEQALTRWKVESKKVSEANQRYEKMNTLYWDMTKMVERQNDELERLKQCDNLAMPVPVSTVSIVIFIDMNNC